MEARDQSENCCKLCSSSTDPPLYKSTFFFLTPDYLVQVSYDTDDNVYYVIRHSRLTGRMLEPCHTFSFDHLLPAEHQVPPGASRVFAYLPWSNQLALFIHHQVALIRLVFDEKNTKLPPPDIQRLHLEADENPLFRSTFLQWNAVAVDEESQMLFVQGELVKQKQKEPSNKQIQQALFLFDPEDGFLQWKTGNSEEVHLGPALFIYLTTTTSESDPEERHLIIGIKELHPAQPSLQKPVSSTSSTKSSPSSVEPDAPLVSLVAITHLILVTPSIERTFPIVTTGDAEKLHQKANIFLAPLGVPSEGRFQLITVSPPSLADSGVFQKLQFFHSKLCVSYIYPSRQNPSLFTGFGHSGYYGPCSTWEVWREDPKCTEKHLFLLVEKLEYEDWGTIDCHLVADTYDFFEVFRRKNEDEDRFFIRRFPKSFFNGCGDDDTESSIADLRKGDFIKPNETTFYFLMPAYLVAVTYDTEQGVYKVVRHCRLTKKVIEPVYTFWLKGLLSEHLVPGASRVFTYLPWSNQLVLFIHYRVALVELNFNDEQSTILPLPTYFDLRLKSDKEPSSCHKVLQWNAVAVDEEEELLYLQGEVQKQQAHGNRKVQQLLYIFDPKESSFTRWKRGALRDVRIGPALFMRLATTTSEGGPVERHLIIGIKEIEYSRPTESYSSKQTSPLVSLVAITHLILVSPPNGITSSQGENPVSLYQEAAILMAPLGGSSDGRFHLMSIPPPASPTGSSYDLPQIPRFFQMSLKVSEICPGTQRPSLFTGFGRSGHYGPASSWEDWEEVCSCTELHMLSLVTEEEAIKAIDYRLVADANELCLIYRNEEKNSLHFRLIPQSNLTRCIDAECDFIKPNDSTFFFLTSFFFVVVTYDTEKDVYKITRRCRRTRIDWRPVYTFHLKGTPAEHLVPGASRVFAYLPWSNQLVLFIDNRIALIELTFSLQPLLPKPKYINLNFKPAEGTAKISKWNALAIDEEAKLIYVQGEGKLIDSNGNFQVKQLLFILNPEDQSFVPLVRRSQKVRHGPALFMHMVSTKDENNQTERHLIIGIKEEHPPLTLQKPISKTSKTFSSSVEQTGPLVSLVAITHCTPANPSQEFTVKIENEKLQRQAAIFIVPGVAYIGRFSLMTIPPPLSAGTPIQNLQGFTSILKVSNTDLGTVEHPSRFKWKVKLWLANQTRPPLNLFFPSENKVLIEAADYRLVGDARELYVIFSQKDKDGEVKHIIQHFFTEKTDFMNCDN